MVAVVLVEEKLLIGGGMREYFSWVWATNGGFLGVPSSLDFFF